VTVCAKMEKNNNELSAEDAQILANGHAHPNANGVVHQKTEPVAPAADGWRQVLWNTWDAFADVAWFIICCIGYILQASLKSLLSQILSI